MEKIIIQWLGHSCFKLTFDLYSVIIDPYENNSVPGLEPLQAASIDVLSSHSHHDHNALHCVKSLMMYAPAPTIKKIATFHDEVNGAQRGENIVHVFEYNGMRIAHFGDIGHKLSSKQIEEIGVLDLAMIPVGGFYTIDAKTAKEVANQLNAKIVIPMHYRSNTFGFDVIAPLEDYTNLCNDVIYYDTNTFELEPSTQKQTAALKYIPI